MNKTELVKVVAKETGLSQKDAAVVADVFINTISGALQNGESVNLPGLGKFEVRDRAARNGRNPQTGEALAIPASKAPAFKPAKALKEAVKGA